MKIYTLLLLCLIGSFSPSRAQQTAIYQDPSEAFKRGVYFFEHSMFGKAQEEFEKVMKMGEPMTEEPFPTYTEEAAFYSAVASLRLNNPDAEKNLLHFVYRMEPHYLASRAKLELGIYYFSQKDYPLVIQYLEKIEANQYSSNQQAIEIKFKLGYAYFEEEKYKQAERELSAIKNIQKSPYYEPANYYYGLTAFLLNEYRNALESFELLQNSPQYGRIIPSYLCQIYFANKQYASVIHTGEQAIRDEKARELNQIRLLVGQSYFVQKDYAKALPLLEQYIHKSNKVSQEVLYQTGYTQYKSGQYEDAIQNFRSLNTLTSALGQNAMYNSADCHLKLGNKREARTFFKQASQMNYDTALREDALINYAKLCFELGFYSEAIDALYRIPSNAFYYNEAQNLLGDIFLNTRDYAKSLELIRKLPNKNAKMRETHQKVAYFRALQLYNDAKYQAAVQHFDESTSLNKHEETQALSHYWKAEALYKQAKYSESKKMYRDFITLSRSIGQLPDNSSQATALYGMGYCEIKNDDYKNAANHFSEAVKLIAANWDKLLDKYVRNKVYPDAVLRAADCYLQQGTQSKRILASKYYKIAINESFPNQDYAMYQQSLIKSLDNKPYEQIVLLNRILRDFPNSRYTDDALYAKGVTYLSDLNDFNLAETSFLELKNQPKYQGSEYRPKALLKLGIISESKNQVEEAKNFYKSVARTNPQSDDGIAALGSLEQLCSEQGTPQEYIIFWEDVTGRKFDELGRDTLIYKAAYKKYNLVSNQNNKDNPGAFDAVITAFNTYLERFPNGYYYLKARQYKANSYYQKAVIFNKNGRNIPALDAYQNALIDYKFLSDTGNPSFAENVNYQAASICYNHTKDYHSAHIYFERLEKVATHEEDKLDALRFGIHSAHLAKKYNAVPPLVSRLLKEPSASASDKARAYYYNGKAYMEKKDYQKAKNSFERNIELSEVNSLSAEARYQIAAITYIDGKLDEALDLVFQTSREIPNQTYWLVKVYILMADIYSDKKNYYQAKATLGSIADNYDGDQALLNEVKNKLEKVKQAEKTASRLQIDNGKRTERID